MSASLVALRARAEAWIAQDPDEATRAALAALRDGADAAALADHVGSELVFGTAGLRGVLGPGPNRMNTAVVLRTSAGVVRHVLASTPRAAERGIVVGYDARRQSEAFAFSAACVFAAAGARVYLFDELTTTPLTSFAVSELGAAAGVMVTASHNPADYNGYKIYWEDGAQIIPPHDHAIARLIADGPGARDISTADLAEARALGTIVSVPSGVYPRYFAGISALAAKRHAPASPLRIVYTPLHGVGYPFARRALAEAGFQHVVPVPEQVEPDPLFPTTPFPNPEEPGVLALAMQLAEREAADLVLANDPDADRLAVAVPDERGKFVQLTGNQVGALLGHDLLAVSAPPHVPRFVVSTIVSSPMLAEIARALGVRYEETLTGFKWIVARAIEQERHGSRFVFGYEEALGYTVGDLVRDKDGVSAAVLFARLAAACKARGTTVLGYLDELYRLYGLHVSLQRNATMAGGGGGERAAAMMAQLRALPPTTIAELVVEDRRDYAAGGKLPPSDVLAYWLRGGTRVVVRPSGTEPKVKVYVDHREEVLADEPLSAAHQRAAARLLAVERDLPRALPGWPTVVVRPR